MKTALISALLVMTIMMISCKGGGWSKAEKDAFVDNCVPGASENPEIDAEKYCNCMLDKVMEKYPKAEDADKVTMEEMFDMAQGCI